jgi:hypothetical protein
MTLILHAPKHPPKPPPPARVPEHVIQNHILRTFGTRPWLRVWRNNTGVAKYRCRTVRFGVTGQADITGILPGGIRLEIEVKAADGVQSQAQKDFAAMIRQMGGVYVLARSVEDVWRAVERFVPVGEVK